MRRVLLALALCAFGVHGAAAQAVMPGTAAKAAAHKAADATSEHVAAEQRTGEPQTKQAAKPNAPAPAAAAGQHQLTVEAPSEIGAASAIIMREAFVYRPEGRRDPFISLLSTSELRPTMSDLKLSSIIFDASGRHSLAILRDIGTTEQYRVTTGSVLGRMRVAAIRPRVIVFSIDEFGMNRQDSLMLGDPTKARLIK